MKYLGNKQRIVNDILPIMLREMESSGRNTFVDAFCGSCSVIQNVPPQYNRIANDKQRYLIAMWKSLVDGKQFPQRIEREYYNKLRDCYNGKNQDYDDDIVGWGGFMASYNGRFYDGGYSGHEVPTKKVGDDGKPLINPKVRDYIREQIRNTMQQVKQLDGVDFQSGEYYNIKMPPRSLIYCDIPYRDTKQYATSKGFDYEIFYDWCRRMTANGHKVFVSEYWMPEDFKCVWQKQITNSMHPTKTKKAIEKLFTL